MDDARPLSSSRPTWIGGAALVFALAAMAVDHLLGTERDDGERGLADPVTFAVAAGLCLVTAALVFGWVVPRARAQGPERAATVALTCSVLSVVPGVALAWLGFPFVVAGAGVDLGLGARAGPRRRLALAAVVVGVAFLAFGVVAYAYAAGKGVSEL